MTVLERLECAAAGHLTLAAWWKHHGIVDVDPERRHYFCHRCGGTDVVLMAWMRRQETAA